MTHPEALVEKIAQVIFESRWSSDTGQTAANHILDLFEVLEDTRWVGGKEQHAYTLTTPWEATEESGPAYTDEGIAS